MEIRHIENPNGWRTGGVVLNKNSGSCSSQYVVMKADNSFQIIAFDKEELVALKALIDVALEVA